MSIQKPVDDQCSQSRTLPKGGGMDAQSFEALAVVRDNGIEVSASSSPMMHFPVDGDLKLARLQAYRLSNRSSLLELPIPLEGIAWK
jgi:hypothetical protein